MCPAATHSTNKTSILVLTLAQAIVSVMQTKSSYILKAIFKYISTRTLLQMYFCIVTALETSVLAQRSSLNLPANKLIYANLTSIGVSFYFHISDE